MSSTTQNSFQRTAAWLASLASHGRVQLPEAAMLLLWLSAAQEAEGDAERAGGTKYFERRVGAETSSQRAHALRRSQVHFKCDNSAKV